MKNSTKVRAAILHFLVACIGSYCIEPTFTRLIHAGLIETNNEFIRKRQKKIKELNWKNSSHTMEISRKKRELDGLSFSKTENKVRISELQNEINQLETIIGFNNAEIEDVKISISNAETANRNENGIASPSTPLALGSSKRDHAPPKPPAAMTESCEESTSCFSAHHDAVEKYNTWLTASKQTTPVAGLNNLANTANMAHNHYVKRTRAAAEEKFKATDNCNTSQAVSGTEAINNEKLSSCKATDRYVTTAQVTQTAAEMGGSMAVNVAGSAAVGKAQISGKLSDTYDGTAETYKMTARMRTVQAGVSTLNAVMVGARGSSHLSDASMLDAKATEAEKAAKAPGAASGTQVQETEKAEKLRMAAVEQREKGVQAQAVAIAQAVRAAQQTVEAGIAEQGRADHRKLARDARKGEALAANTSDNVPPLAPDVAEAVTAGQSNALSGSATAETSANTEEEVIADPKGLGDSTNINGGGNELAGTPPAPSGFTGGGGASGSSGPGGGGFSGGSTSASQPEENAEGSATMAERISNPNKYGVGGPGGYGAANAGKGAAANNGPDLSGLLASLLPKEEKDAGPRNGILDYGDGRAPASEAPFSPLSRDADIFKVVHDAYQDKHRRGAVGL